MLRNSLKIAFCGIISILLAACTATHPILVSGAQNTSLKNVKIKAEPKIEYRISGVVKRLLPHYVKDPNNYIINITVKESSSSAIYTQKEVAKEQLRMAALVEVYDKEYDKIGSRLVDSFSTYEVCDEMPFSVLASQTQARNAIADSLAESIITTIKNIIG